MNTYSWVAIGILTLGFFICLFFILWGKRKQTKGIDSYKRIRDKLTVREPEPEKEYTGCGLSISNLIGGFVVILIGVSLIGPVSEQVGLACDDMSVSNMTNTNDLCGDGLSGTIFGLMGVFFALAIACMTIGMIASGLRGSGII